MMMMTRLQSSSTTRQLLTLSQSPYYAAFKYEVALLSTQSLRVRL